MGLRFVPDRQLLADGQCDDDMAVKHEQDRNLGLKDLKSDPIRCTVWKADADGVLTKVLRNEENMV